MAEGASGSTLARSLWGTGGLFGSDPSYSGVMVPKSEEFEDRYPAYLSQLDHLFQSSLGTGRRFARDWRGGQADAERRAKQEIGAIDPFFTGAYEAQQAGQRGNLGLAYDRAAALGQDYLTNQLNSNKVAGLHGFGGGNSSYVNRQALRGATEINLQKQLALAEREREDAERAISYRLGTTGAREGIASAAIRRKLEPWNVQQNLYNQNLGNLNNLQSTINSNRIFGVQQDVSDVDKFFNTMDAFQSTIEAPIDKVMSLYGSMYGGGYGGGGGGAGGGAGGGGGPAWQPYSNAQWAPPSSAATMSYAPPTSLGGNWNVNPYGPAPGFGGGYNVSPYGP